MVNEIYPEKAITSLTISVSHLKPAMISELLILKNLSCKICTYYFIALLW